MCIGTSSKLSCLHLPRLRVFTECGDILRAGGRQRTRQDAIFSHKAVCVHAGRLIAKSSNGHSLSGRTSCNLVVGRAVDPQSLLTLMIAGGQAFDPAWRAGTIQSYTIYLSIIAPLASTHIFMRRAMDVMRLAPSG